MPNVQTLKNTEGATLTATAYTSGVALVLSGVYVDHGFNVLFNPGDAEPASTVAISAGDGVNAAASENYTLPSGNATTLLHPLVVIADVDGSQHRSSTGTYTVTAQADGNLYFWQRGAY